MKFNITKAYGPASISVEIEEQSLEKALLLASFFTCEDKCVCGGTNISLNGRRVQDYTFIYRKCASCGKESQAGQYKTGGMFWKGWEEPFNKDNSNAPKKESQPGF